jgi:hypothetical protein
MKRIALMAAASLLAAGCQHFQSNANYFIEREEAAYNATCEGTTQGLKGEACRLHHLGVDQLKRFRREATILQFENATVFGLSTYIGSTLLLNSDGLSASQSEDLTEAALAGTVLAGTRVLRDSERLSSLHFNAYRASVRAARELYALDGLAGAVAAADGYADEIPALIQAVRDTRQAVETAQITGDAITALNTRADAAIAAGTAARTRQIEQSSAYRAIDISAEQLYDNYASRILNAVRPTRVDLASVLQILQTAQQSNTAFLSSGSGDTSGEEKGTGDQAPASREATAFASAVETLEAKVRDLEAATPNIVTRSARLALCESLFSPDFDLPSITAEEPKADPLAPAPAQPAQEAAQTTQTPTPQIPDESGGPENAEASED